MGQRLSFRRPFLSLVLLPVLVLGPGGVAAFAAPQMLPAVTPAERALKECPAAPGAPAVYLFRGYTKDHENRTLSESFRIKILTPAGKDYATVEVPFSESWEVDSIRASVMKPDGRVVPFTGEIFEKTVVQVGGFKWLVKTFALPDIEVGSIIDYVCDLKYNLKKGGGGRDLRLAAWEPEEGGEPDFRSLTSYTMEIWDFEAPLFTYKARYTYVPPAAGGLVRNGEDNFLRLAWVSYGLTWGPPVLKDGRIELEVENIPARQREDCAAPEEEGRMGVTFFLCSTKILRAEDYWSLERANWEKAVQKFTFVTDPIEAESKALVAKATTPREKLRALYARAQSIKNLSYDREMTPMRRKELRIKDNRNAAEVLKRNSGLRSDITRTFVALARAAGFKADVARVVTRDDKLFHENVLSLYDQFDSEVAIVEVDGSETFLDPATPGCPLGLVRWNCTDTTFIRTLGGPRFFSATPLDPPDRSSIRRAFDLRLDPSGALSGTLSLTCTGHEALDVRLGYLGTDEAEVKKTLAEKMTALLPEGGQAALRKVENMAGFSDELRLDFDITVPGAATPAGDRLIMPVVPYSTSWRNSFRHAGRTGPVSFPYPSRETDDIVITLPAGMAVETLPSASRSERSFANYALSAEAGDGTKLRVRREMTIGKIRIPLEQYPVLKSFFDQARAGDEGQVVLGTQRK
jgi:hypothetical protein